MTSSTRAKVPKNAFDARHRLFESKWFREEIAERLCLYCLLVAKSIDALLEATDDLCSMTDTYLASL
ncbi:hypothetical protein ACVWZ4_002857 [Bradyrhizobium sp. USDA 4472]